MIQPIYRAKPRLKITLSRNEYLPLCLLLVFYTVIHLITHPGFGDDIIFSRALDKSALLPWLQERYNTWSSRLLPEAILVLVLRLPLFLWKAADIAMILLLFHSLRQLLDSGKRLKDGIVLAMLLCCYPFTQMGSAGWVTTTINYLWPLTLGVYAVSGMWRYLQGEALPWYRYFLYVLAAVYTCGNELSAVMLLAASIWGMVYAAVLKRRFAFSLLVFFLTTGGIAFILTAPGNVRRMEAEILQWMPCFPQMNLLNKLHIGIVSTFEQFTSLSNVALFLFCLLTYAMMCRETVSLNKRIIGFLPLMIQVGFKAYFLSVKLFTSRNFRFPEYASWLDIGSKTWFAAVAPIAFALMIAGLLLSLVWLIKNRCQLATILLALGAGLATRLSLSLSPTVVASGTRTYIFLYIVLLAVVFVLWKRGLHKKVEYLFYASVGAGMAYNIVGTFLLQRNFL